MCSPRRKSSRRKPRACAPRTSPSVSFRSTADTAWMTTPCVRSDPSGPLPLVEIAPVFLRRTSLAGRDHRRRVLELPVKLLAGRPGLGRLFVEQRGLRGGPATVAQRPHDHDVLVGAEPHAYRVAGLHVARGLHALAVHGYLATLDRRHRDRTRLEEPRRPEPLVHPDGCRRGHLLSC